LFFVLPSHRLPIMAATLFTWGLPIGTILMYMEEHVIPTILQLALKTDSLWQNPKHYGLVIIVNAVGSGFTLIGLGMKVGKARTQCKEMAIRNGEKDVEYRYSLPNMYVDGNTEAAKKFNCVQRGHQQALETYPQFLCLSVLGGIRFPLFTALTGIIWMYSRVKWAEGYASGDPAVRYSHWASKGIWYALLFGSMASIGTALRFMEVV
jgi:glutathione S-transferase